MTNGIPAGDGIATCATPEETAALGARLAAALPPDAVVSLEGPLGAGKTCFVRGFLAARGFAGDVSSPTFTLMHEYATPGGTVAHFDWYRLERAADVAALGWDDYLDGGDTLLVEWGDRFPELLPAGAWRVRLEIDGAARRVRWGRVP